MEETKRVKRLPTLAEMEKRESDMNESKDQLQTFKEQVCRSVISGDSLRISTEITPGMVALVISELNVSNCSILVAMADVVSKRFSRSADMEVVGFILAVLSFFDPGIHSLSITRAQNILTGNLFMPDYSMQQRVLEELSNRTIPKESPPERLRRIEVDITGAEVEEEEEEVSELQIVEKMPISSRDVKNWDVYQKEEKQKLDEWMRKEWLVNPVETAENLSTLERMGSFIASEPLMHHLFIKHLEMNRWDFFDVIVDQTVAPGARLFQSLKSDEVRDYVTLFYEGGHYSVINLKRDIRNPQAWKFLVFDSMYHGGFFSAMAIRAFHAKVVQWGNQNGIEIGRVTNACPGVLQKGANECGIYASYYMKQVILREADLCAAFWDFDEMMRMFYRREIIDEYVSQRVG